MQHDFNLANQSGENFRADLNNALNTIATNSSGANEPSTTFAYQFWVDTTNSLMKIRNSADDAWITLPFSISSDNTVDINGGTVNGITSLSFSSGSTVSSILDEDNLSSDSNTALATQQSIKAYVDAQVTAQDLDFQADSGGALSIDLDSESLTVSGGTGIDTSGSGNEITVAIDSTVATKTYVQQQITAEDLDFQADSGGVLNIDLDSETFTLTGGTGIDTVGAENTVTFAIDSTVATLTDSQTLTNKTIDVDNNTLSNIEVDNLKSGVLDTDLSSVSSSDDTLASSKAIKTYVDAQVTAQDLDLTDGSTTISIDLDSETLSVLGGTGVTSAASGNGVTLSIGQAVGTTDDVTFNSVTANVTGTVSSIVNHSTSDLSEGTNLYYTTARFDTRLATKDTGDLSEGSNLYFTNERVDDRVSNLLTAGSNITLTYDDAANTLTIAAVEDDLSNNDTDDLSEGSSNLYYTDARARAAISVSGSLAYNSSTGGISFTERTDSEVRGLLSAAGDLSYNSSTGEFSFTQRTDAQVRGLISVSGDLSYNASTGVISFTQRTDAQVRALLSASGDLSYDSSTGVISFTQRTDAQVRALLSAGTGITYDSSSGAISIGQDVSTTSNVTFNDVVVSGNLTVSGTQTIVNTETVTIADNIIVLNSNATGSPSENSGIEIERGSATNKTLIWDESNDKWTVGSETFVAATFEGSVTGTVSSISNHDTDNLSEGSSNLYYTSARANADFDTRIATKDTGDLSEGSNLYYTDTRARAAISLGSEGSASGDGSIAYNNSTGVLTYTPPVLSGLSGNTDDISEGSTNQYHTTERVQDVVGGQIVTNGSHTGISFSYDDANDGAIDATVSLSSFDTDNLSEGSSNLYHTTERVQDVVGGQLVTNGSHTGISFTYDDANDGAVDATVSLSSFSTSNLSEGSNLYYTNERVDDRVNALLQAGSNITLTYDDAANTLTIAATEDNLSNNDTDDLSEGSTNLYFTNERVDDRVNSLLTAGTGISLTYDDAANTLTITGSAQYGDSDVESYLDGGSSTPTFASAIVSGDLTIDTNTLKVDSSNNRVGILDATPAVSLDIGSATDAIHVPSGTTGERPTGANGMFRYNSTDNQFEGYADGAWGAIAGSGSNGASAMETDNFTGDDSTTAFTLSSSVSDEDNLIVFIEGVYQNKGDYVASGTTITFDVAPLAGRKIVVHHVRAAISGSNCILNSFTGDGSDTTFTLTQNPASENNTQIFIDGVYQRKDSYSVSGTTLTFDAAPANGTAIEVMMFTQTDINTLPASFVSGLTEVTATGSDHLMVYDATDGALKKALASDLIETVGSTPTFTSLTVDSDNTDTSIIIESDLDPASLFTSGIDLRRETVAKGSRIESLRDASAGGVGLNFLTTADNAAEVSGTLTSRMSIDRNGMVLIGQDSGDAFNDDSMLRIQRTGDRVFQQFKCDADQNVQILFGDVDDDVECSIQYHASDKDLRFTTGNNNEAMRIKDTQRIGMGAINPEAQILHIHKSTTDTSPLLYVQNSASTVSTNSELVRLKFSGDDAFSNCDYIKFEDSSGEEGVITGDGGGRVYYEITSDYRKKENIVDYTGGLDVINDLSVKNYNMITRPDITYTGFIAHEVQDVVDGVARGEKDAVDDEGNPIYQGLDMSKLVPHLVSAIQELKTELDAAKARIETLENA